MDLMKKTVSLSSGAIQTPIVFEHRKNNIKTNETLTTATGVALQDFKFKGETIAFGKRFILSPRVDELTFLNEDAKRNDVIMEDSVIWYVIETTLRDVELDILCSRSVFTQTTKSAKF